MGLLVTGFGSFPGVAANPTERLVPQLGHHHEVLRVSYRAVEDFLASDAARHCSALVCLGVAARRDRITPELFGRNAIGRAQDVDGESGPREIEAAAPALLGAAAFPVEAVARLSVGAPVRASEDAGNYVCNYLYYRALQRLPDRPVLFIHVPPFEKVDEQTQLPLLRTLVAAVG